MPSLLLRAPLLALLPALLLGAAPPAKTSGPAAAKVASTAAAAAPAKNASATKSVDAPKATVKLASKPAVVPTAAIKVSSTKTRTSGPILSAPKTGAMPVPKAIQRHVQNSTLDVAMQPKASHLRATPAAGHIAFMNASDMIAHAAADCACHFDNQCGCHAAMEFMTCVAKACLGGGCDCKKYEFMGACGAIANTCPELAISCGKERAECIHPNEVAVGPKTVKVDMPLPKDEKKKEKKAQAAAEAAEEEERLEIKRDEIYDDLRELKEKKCQLEVAARDGWLNADRRLKETNSEIAEKLEWLEEKGYRIPEMHCEKHFEEWHDAPSPRPQAVQPAKIEKEPEPTPEPEPATEPRVQPKGPPLWSAPEKDKGAAAGKACPVLLVAGLMAAVLA